MTVLSARDLSLLLVTYCAYSSLLLRQKLMDGLQSVCDKFKFNMFIRKARTVKMSKLKKIEI